MDLPQLTTYLEHCMGVAAGAYGLTFLSATSMFACGEPQRALCMKEFGGDGEKTFVTLTEGFSNESTASDMALWQLARTAAYYLKLRQPSRKRTLSSFWVSCTRSMEGRSS